MSFSEFHTAAEAILAALSTPWASGRLILPQEPAATLQRGSD